MFKIAITKDNGFTCRYKTFANEDKANAWFENCKSKNNVFYTNNCAFAYKTIYGTTIHVQKLWVKVDLTNRMYNEDKFMGN